MFCQELLVVTVLRLAVYGPILIPDDRVGPRQAAADPKKPPKLTPPSHPRHTQNILIRGLTRRSVLASTQEHCLTKGFYECNSMWIKCDCFKYFIFWLKAIFYSVFIIFFVFGPAQLDLYILTDGALPLPAHLLPRIVANVKLVSFFCPCVVCTGYIKICYVV